MCKLRHNTSHNIIFRVNYWLKLKINTISLIIVLLASMHLTVTAKGLYDTTVQPAAYQPTDYLPLLKNKRIALVINQTSDIKGKTLLDVLIDNKIDVRRVFVPEHGFRGTEDAGAKINNSIDSTTGLPVVSLYGSNKKPKQEQLTDIDVLVYDLQDVGVRFYTYISTLEYCMEACAEGRKELIILDRPNPNGFYVDGPVLEKQHKSFVGMQSIPIVYGMTAGEYATMLKGENWITNSEKLKMEVVKCHNYTHAKLYKLPIPPSPNLQTMEAVYAYPSLCLFEGTVISVGRGTDKPFRQFGCPEFVGKYTYEFIPVSTLGAKKPPYENQKCYGAMVAENETTILKTIDKEIQLKWLIDGYKNYPNQEKYFNSFFTKLAGNKSLEINIKNGWSEKRIKDSWKLPIKKFKETRKKYLLYPEK